MIKTSDGTFWGLGWDDDQTVADPDDNSALQSHEEFCDSLIGEDDSAPIISIYAERPLSGSGPHWCVGSLEDVMNRICRRRQSNAWSDVYLMPWGHAYVLYRGADCGGYDVEEKLARFDSYEDYLEEVTIL